MRNLKKVLTLVLTLAMLLSVMVVGAGAATFGDQDSITNDEAVDMCVALNIIGGYEDGTFRPAGNVTRAEMCKMICVALNGGKEPTMGSGLISTFNDVSKDDWSAPYIEYCVSQGIVGGVGGGRFNPNGNITGTQAAKMLLCILGYNASIQGYVGNDYWETKINVDAAQKGLYDELSNIDASAALTRDQAAQMIWNALQAYEVEYVTTLVTGPNGELTSKVIVQDKVVNAQKNEKVTLLKDKYEALVKYGYMKQVDYESIKGEYTYTFDPAVNIFNNGEAISSDDAYTGKLTTTKDFTDLFGQKVAVVYKSNTKAVYGMYAESSVIASDIVGNITDGDGNDINLANTQIKIGDAKFKMDKTTLSATPVYTYNVQTPSKVLTDYTSNGYYSIDAIDHNGDNKIDCFVIYPVAVEKVTYVGTNSLTAGGSYNYDKDDKLYSNNGIDYNFPDVSKDDWVAIDQYGVNEMTRKVAAVGTVEGEITAMRGTNVEINGNWYEQVKNPGDSTFGVGDTVALTAIGGYYFNVKVIDGKTLDNVLMILEAGNNSSGIGSGVEARVMYAKDGSVATISKISKVNDTSATVPMDSGDPTTPDANPSAVTHYTGGNVVVGALYTYKEKDGTVELTRLDDNVIGDWKFDKSTTAFEEDSVRPTVDGKPIADDAIVMVYNKDNDKHSFTTGAALKTWGDDYGDTVQYLYDTINGVATITAVALYDADATKIPGMSGTDGYGYVTKNAIYTKDGDDKYAVLTIWTADGELKDVKAESLWDINKPSAPGFNDPSETNVNSAAAAQRGAFVTFKKLSNGNISDLNVVGNAFAMTGATVNRDGDTDLVLKNNNGTTTTSMTVTKDTQIIFVNTKDKLGAEKSGKLNDWLALETAAGGTYILNVMAKGTVNNGVTEADVLFVDVNHRLENVSNTVSIDCGIAGAASTSSNLQLVFKVTGTNNWFTPEQISKLGITQDMITVKVDGTVKELVPTASTNEYPWNGTAVCVMAGSTWSGFDAVYTTPNAGFMKVHVYEDGVHFTTAKPVDVSIKNTDDITFNFISSGYKVDDTP